MSLGNVLHSTVADLSSARVTTDNPLRLQLLSRISTISSTLVPDLVAPTYIPKSISDPFDPELARQLFLHHWEAYVSEFPDSFDEEGSTEKFQEQGIEIIRGFCEREAKSTDRTPILLEQHFVLNVGSVVIPDTCCCCCCCCSHYLF